ncbi:nucleotidyltransferase substrate binding protein [Rheinheimera oceanensis]|uniref:nucleotidyltransferase substrate binding protein n=1 Tax=Rheinheimera oceanensis TaxID=2817449 RepID=UPI001BFD9082|nr:nucleotidyltransferase substrate binding protein [Rheinheimera oceanensis]
MNTDIRWQQRLANFTKALAELSDAIALAEQRKLTKLEQQGLIQAFEYNYELAWNCIKDFYQFQGETDIQGSRDAIRLAFSRGLISDGELWMNMIKSRALTSHTYNQDTANAVADDVLKRYYPAFVALYQVLNEQQNAG